jgi:hypothetical protein
MEEQTSLPVAQFLSHIIVLSLLLLSLSLFVVIIGVASFGGTLRSLARCQRDRVVEERCASLIVQRKRGCLVAGRGFLVTVLECCRHAVQYTCCRSDQGGGCTRGEQTSNKAKRKESKNQGCIQRQPNSVCDVL